MPNEATGTQENRFPVGFGVVIAVVCFLLAALALASWLFTSDDGSKSDQPPASKPSFQTPSQPKPAQGKQFNL
jgi:hypothetical protein